MDLGLRDRVCVLTASTAGVGLAAARMLVEEGARVVTCSRRKDPPGIGEALHVRDAAVDRVGVGAGGHGGTRRAQARSLAGWMQ